MFNIAAMTSNHFVYIPLVALFGVAIGYGWGAKAARADMERRRRQLRED